MNFLRETKDKMVTAFYFCKVIESFVTIKVSKEKNAASAQMTATLLN
jgi:hypothetical protein